jgi:inhibitor of KinA sporulation pathway (predicted exonuclease)
VDNQIEQMLKDAWEKFRNYYGKRAPRYRDSWRQQYGLDIKYAKKSNWICWDEYDLMFLIERFFYDILKQKRERILKH